MLKTLRPLLRIATELRRIATALEYFAIDHARQNNRMFTPAGRSRFGGGKDDSDLLHTDDAVIAEQRQKELQLMLQRGYPALEAEDQIDENPNE